MYWIPITKRMFASIRKNADCETIDFSSSPVSCFTELADALNISIEQDLDIIAYYLVEFLDIKHLISCAWSGNKESVIRIKVLRRVNLFK